MAKEGRNPLLLEASPHIGGISRTHCWGENRIDIGGRRFFTKSEDVQRLWADMMDEPMLKVPRMSRIFYGDQFYQYPLQILNTVGNLGVFESFMMFASYVKARIKPFLPEDSFKDWVRNRFSDRLYRTFFHGFANLQTVGRNGMHRYNNQDHSMLAGHHAALRLLGRPKLDPWEVNTERNYYEEQVLSSDKKREGMDILVSEKAPPHESV